MCRAVRTAIPGEAIPVELLGQDHGRPAYISAIFADRLAKCKLSRGDKV